MHFPPGRVSPGATITPTRRRVNFFHPSTYPGLI